MTEFKVLRLASGTGVENYNKFGDKMPNYVIIVIVAPKSTCFSCKLSKDAQ